AIATAPNRPAQPEVAFDGTNYLVVWQDFRSFYTNDVYGTRVTPEGAVLDPNGIAISTADNDQQAPVLAFDGTEYIVAWQDARSGTGQDLYGARVSRAGSVRDASGFAIATSGTDETSPVAVRGPYSGRVAVAYQRFAPEAPYS